MNYLDIKYDNMLNGDGLRVVLWLAGCEHYCDECFNPQTWNPNNGKTFDGEAKNIIYFHLNNEYIDGITFSGGDPLYKGNLNDLYNFIIEIKEKYPNKTIWLYTGYTWEEIMNYIPTETDDFNYIEESYENELYKKRQEIIYLCDVIVDGEFKKELADVNYPHAGSTNQRVIDVKASLKKGEPVLWNQKETIVV